MVITLVNVPRKIIEVVHHNLIRVTTDRWLVTVPSNIVWEYSRITSNNV